MTEPTWTPRYTVQKAPGVPGNPIAQDEPCIVIRGQDVLAVTMINAYLLLYKGLAKPTPRVIAELEQHREAVLDWQLTHVLKVADR